MKKIVVAGGGLVGSLIAIMMKKRGYEVALLEKRADIRQGDQQANADGRSINLVVTSRGLNALEKAGLLRDVLPMTVPVTGRMIHGKIGAPAYQPYGRDASECNYSVSRGDLNRFLLNACERRGVRILFEAAVDASTDLREKKVKFSLPGQDRRLAALDYDVLLGADGAGSVLRKSIKDVLGSSYHDETEFLSSDYKELFMPALADGGSPLQRNVLHIWPRGTHMLMALPNSDGSFTMTIYLPSRGAGLSFETLKTEQQVQSFLRDEFPDAYDLMTDAVHEFISHPEGKLGTVRSAPWIYQESVALLGDAAHAIVPFFGQGMNLGFEDCVYLDKYLTEFQDDWAPALIEYDRSQRPNANAIADMALENFVEMRDKVGDARFLLMKKIEARIENEMPDIYRSRYGMIAYTLIPYALAREAGQIQERLLHQLCDELEPEKDLNMDMAKRLVEQEFVPYLRTNNISVERYQIPRSFV